MKKIYLTLLPCLLFTILLTGTAKAQSSCPPGVTPTVSALNIGNNFCVVYADHMTPDSIVVVLDMNLQPIGFSRADATGFASIQYSCNTSAYRLSCCVTGVGCCNVPVPPLSILPSKLSAFTAEIGKANTVLLKWTSAFERSSFSYVVQKSADGKKFTDAGEIPAAGNAAKAINYEFADVKFFTSIGYYRLKQIDIDGKIEYSRVVYVNNRKNFGSVKSVAPNPFTSDLQLIGISSSEIQSKNIRVFNGFGQTIAYRITGANSIAIDGAAPNGVYYLRVKDQIFKLIKQ